MHQNPRMARAVASASSRANTSGRDQYARDEAASPESRPDSRMERSDERPGTTGETEDGFITSSRRPATASKDVEAKLSQIVQNYFVKAALIIAQARMICPPSYSKGNTARRVNKWFNVEIDETDIFREDWRLWKTCDVVDNRPPPMIMETYLDTANLTSSQSLVVLDEQGNRWNVSDALNASDSPISTQSGRSQRTKVILERWIIELGDQTAEFPPNLEAILPVIYKKNIVLFRSLYTYSKFLPAWKFAKRLAKLRSNHGAFKVACRIRSSLDTEDTQNFDALTVPLYGTGYEPATESFSFGSTSSPAGPFGVSVTYRTSCEFRIDDSEEILSSHFMGLDDHLFRPSLGGGVDVQRPEYLATAGAKDVGSLPSERRGAERPDRTQAYGSLSTFHQVAPAASSSPLTALRNARELGLDSASSSPPRRPQPSARSAQGSRGSLRSEGAMAAPATMPRRPSVSFQPFKSPSLTASPHGGLMVSSPRNSMGRPGAAGPLAQAQTQAQARTRTSADLSRPSSLRESPVIRETGLAPASISPRPAAATRYVSSFGHRRAKPSSGGASKTDDENTSSGKASAASSAQPGSGSLTERALAGGGNGDSSGSIKTDDDNISDFLKMLDLKKNLRSFEPASAVATANVSSQRTCAALSKFQKMRDSNAVLSESMSSSSLLHHHRSSSSSSRQLSSVPPMVTGTSLSTSSSPGKPISPHTPHTPAIPSRLSANSVIEYAQPRRSRTETSRRRGSSRLDRASVEDADETREESVREGGGTSTAIDIPTSPRPFHPHNRRSSSVTQQQRVLPVEDELGVGDLLPFGMRSASMGAEDRPPLSLSALLGLQEASEESSSAAPADADPLPGSREADISQPMSRQHSSSFEDRLARPTSTAFTGGSTTSGPSSLAAPYRPRIGRTSPSLRGAHNSAAGGSSTSLNIHVGSGSQTSDALRPSLGASVAGSRYSFSRSGVTAADASTGTGTASGFEEDEPLLFAMSEIGNPQLSIDKARGGDSTSSSRRGASRGKWRES